MSIRSAHKSDWSSIKDIYQLGIDSKNATFETAPPDSYEEWFSKFDKNNVFVHEVDKKINGWITLSHYSSRCCYEGWVKCLSMFILMHKEKVLQQNSITIWKSQQEIVVTGLSKLNFLQKTFLQKNFLSLLVLEK